MLATAFLSYAGPYNQEFRGKLSSKWKKEMVHNKIPHTNDLKIIEMLVDNATISEWELQGLPNDELSMQNGLIVSKAARYPLLIDPQGQGKTWIKNREANNGMQITTLNSKYFRQVLEESLTSGRPMLIEDIAEELDPILDNVLEKNFIRTGTRMKVKLGDRELDYMEGFHLYITTKLANPVYRPEIAARTAIIDFTVTTMGLEDQLLSIVIVKEKADLERARKELSEEVTHNKRKVKELEDNLLYRLTSTEGSLVDDEQLIHVLYSTKTTAEEVKEKLRIAAETEVQINKTREEFRPVAARGSILYFLIVEMSLVNCMYQTSLKQFLGLFENSIVKSTRSPYTNKRIQNIIDYLTYDVFKYTCRGLYERDKFTLTLQMAFKIQLQQKAIRSEEFELFLKGGAALDLNAVEPKPKKWITDVTWLNLVALSNLLQFSNITRQVVDNDKVWRQWFDSDAPEEITIPEGYSQLSTWHKLLLIRSWCPDRTVPMARRYIAEALGDAYAEGVVLNWEALYEESSTKVPLVALLSTGSDPTDDIERLGKKYGIRTAAISMGQGQEYHARRLLQQGLVDGVFVLFQNCHLGLPFMEELMETLAHTEDINEDFRCWITTEPHENFPINFLQTSIKFTNEPPQGVKAGLRRTYALLTQELLDYTNAYQWKPMLYAVAFLHTVVQERRKFGPIGWNIPYEFNQADFTSTVQFLQNHLDDMDPKKGVSWTTVSYMIGEVQYGGRVTDDFDKRLLNTFARVWFRDAMFTDQFEFGRGYSIPKCNKLDEFQKSIDQMGAVDSPECFGLHLNADITYQTNTANKILSTIMSIQPKENRRGTGETREQVVYRLCDDMLGKLPNGYNPHDVKERLKKLGYLQPLNIFLGQEIGRIQKVIQTVRSTLTDLKLAIDGTIIMNEALKEALDYLFDARIPPGWGKISWDSTTLGFWFTDLLDRNGQYYTWLHRERPDSFWLTGFFNPQGFLTAMKQEIARAHKGWTLDSVQLANEVTKMNKEDVGHAPSEGVYIHGLYLEGAAWDRRNGRLTESAPKALHALMPVIWVYAVNEVEQKASSYYECPVYKKPRRTDLTYIFPLQLRTIKVSLILAIES